MVGEITNMTCGGAKNELGQKDYGFGMATAVVVSGKNNAINHQVDGRKWFCRSHMRRATYT
jgi:chemotaxis protein CheX